MTTITITVQSVYDQVKLVLNGVPEGITPYNIIDGSLANLMYYIAPVIPFGNGILTSSVLGNDEISIDGYSGTYYTVTITDIRSQTVIYEADFEITGETFDLDTATPLSVSPIPNVNPIPEPATYVTRAYVDAGDAATLAAAETYTNNLFNSIDALTLEGGS